MKSDISENLILFDWLTVSCKEEDPQVWVKLLGMEGCSWDEMDHGRNGYRKGLYYGSITVLYDGSDGMGICLDMSGQGCRTFESDGSGDFDGLFGLIQAQPERYHMTRLDVAFDDHTGILPIKQLFEDTDRQEYISKFRQSRIEKQFVDGRAGITVYHGSKKSDVLFRIYDKAAERGLPEEQHWVRVEMQLRNDRGLAFVGSPEPVGITFRGVLVNYLRYVDPDPFDSNNRRWPTKTYWQDLIDGVGAIRLYVKPGTEYNIMQLDHFVFDQAGNAISAALAIHGAAKFFDRLHQRSTSGNPKYDRLIDQYGGKKGTHEAESEMRPAIGPSDEVHRGVSWE